MNGIENLDRYLFGGGGVFVQCLDYLAVRVVGEGRRQQRRKVSDRDRSTQKSLEFSNVLAYQETRQSNPLATHATVTGSSDTLQQS